MSEEHKEKIRAAHLGMKKPWVKPPVLDYSRRKTPRGAAHWAWKGGVTPEHHKIRTSYRMQKWRKAVLERDGRKCVLCPRRTLLQVDHIKPFALYPELRFEVSNGRTLCRPCHIKQPTHAGRINKNNQYTVRTLIENNLITV